MAVRKVDEIDLSNQYDIIDEVVTTLTDSVPIEEQERIDIVNEAFQLIITKLNIEEVN